MRLIDADAMTMAKIKVTANATAACGETTADAVNGMDGVSMTRKDKLLECQREIEEGMGELVKSKDLCWQNRLVFWLGKAMLMMIEKEVRWNG